jgi:hypothetical protein
VKQASALSSINIQRGPDPGCANEWSYRCLPFNVHLGRAKKPSWLGQNYNVEDPRFGQAHDCPGSTGSLLTADVHVGDFEGAAGAVFLLAVADCEGVVHGVLLEDVQTSAQNDLPALISHDAAVVN